MLFVRLFFSLFMLFVLCNRLTIGGWHSDEILMGQFDMLT